MPDDDAVIAEGLSKRFGEAVALDELSLHVPAGTVSTGPVVKAVAWSLGILAVAAPLAVHRYRRV